MPVGGQQLGCVVLSAEPSSPESPRSSAGQNSEPPEIPRLQTSTNALTACGQHDRNWLIRPFNKSTAPLANFFQEMYLSAQSEAGIRMVTRMHYRQQHY